MKNLYQALKQLPVAALILSCTEYETSTLSPVASALKGEPMKVDKGILTFRDRDAYDKFLESTNEWSNQQWSDWEKVFGFKSLSTIFDDVVDSEMAFSEQLQAKYGSNPPSHLTRQDVGYSRLGQKYLDRGLLFLDEFETLDLNVPTDYFSRLINEEGVFRIGDEIHVPKRDFVFIITDLDLRKVKLANDYKMGNRVVAGVKVAEVIRYENISRTAIDLGARTFLTTKCVDTNDNYQLITYDLFTGIIYDYDGSFPCKNVSADYSVRLRSLKKTIWWFNYRTTRLSMTASLQADLYGKCIGFEEYSTVYGTSYFFVKNVVNISNQYYSQDYDHTAEWYFFRNTQVNACTLGGNDTCGKFNDPFYNPTDPEPSFQFPIRSITSTGPNLTTCYVGN